MSENGQPTIRRHVISGAFVFLLLGVFAVFSTFMVLLGGQLYRNIVEETEVHNDRRVLGSYVSNIVRGNDAASVVRVQNIDGVDVLGFCWDVDGDLYETRIYCYDGALRELYTAAEQEFNPDYGEIICQARAFRPSLEGNLLRVELVAPDGTQQQLHIALRCSQEVAP